MDIHDKYVFGRDKVESKRIWLEDVSQLLETPHIQRYYHGFDISSEQFPNNPETIHLSVHDLTAPFPCEHWNRYDLVHVRLVVAGLEESEYRVAITNLYKILKPGGYLQWEELDEETYISKDNPVIWELRRCFDYGLRAEGKCFQASAKIYEESQIVGFVDVERLVYDSHQYPDLRQDTDQRLTAIIRTLYARLLFRSAQVESEDAATEKAEALIEKHLRLCKMGQSPSLKLMRVVGRKPFEASL
ncbi:hypothetical protein ASPCADRAFT_400772 [Aspergillus carbonarius ITEM 5010]|uniref:Methyltransferase type 11 domain-containing protein n=1 Tax=Aspergillus carbonarius (strain ITEM 5010) TaxID=602072 RepID=A0A1R3R7V2_ASPC5|nr:hypothetical protein ASPCADRAFT_400772 [Aspergillus carbonarius ITEM 5010]